MVTDSKLVDSQSFDWVQEQPLSEKESYQALLHSLVRKQGFNLLFVRCTPVQGDRIIKSVKQDLPNKKIEVLTLDAEVDDLFEKIIQLPDYSHLNILFVRGLEAALNRYEEAESLGYFLTSQSPVYGGTWAGVPKILGNLNLARDRFDEQFSFALVFLLPEFALRYFIRRAPDFFDWRSGVFDFPTDLNTLEKEVNRLVHLESDLDVYKQYTPQQRLAKLAEIKAYLSDSSSLDPDRLSELWREKGLIYAVAKEYKEAIASFDRALEINPNYDRAWNSRGVVLDDLGRYEEAIASYDRAIEINPVYDYPWNNRGVALRNLGRYEEAIASYDRAIEINPDYYQAWLNRGNALWNLGRNEEAIPSHDRALEINPDYDRAWFARGFALGELGRHEEAIASYDRALEINPDYDAVWDNRGSVLRNLGRYEQAIASHDRALEINPDYDAAWNNRGNALGDLGRYEEAIASYDRAIEINPDYNNARSNRQISLIKIKQKELSDQNMKDKRQHNESLAIKVFSSLRRLISSLNLTMPKKKKN